MSDLNHGDIVSMGIVSNGDIQIEYCDESFFDHDYPKISLYLSHSQCEQLLKIYNIAKKNKIWQALK